MGRRGRCDGERDAPAFSRRRSCNGTCFMALGTERPAPLAREVRGDTRSRAPVHSTVGGQGPAGPQCWQPHPQWASLYVGQTPCLGSTPPLRWSGHLRRPMGRRCIAPCGGAHDGGPRSVARFSFGLGESLSPRRGRASSLPMTTKIPRFFLSSLLSTYGGLGGRAVFDRARWPRWPSCVFGCLKQETCIGGQHIGRSALLSIPRHPSLLHALAVVASCAAPCARAP